MTKRQANGATLKTIIALGERFKENGYKCTELEVMIDNHKMVLGFAAMLLQASWLHWKANRDFAHDYHNSAGRILFQHYLRQKSKRKKKAKK